MGRCRGFWLTTWLCVGLALAAHAITPVEMLRDMFRKPVTEWKADLQNHNKLLTNDFFENIEKRIRWGIENNHIDDAFRFAMVGDFGAEVKRRPANFRIDLAELFFKAENYLMAAQIIDNIRISSPGTPAANRADFLRGRLLEIQGDLFEAHKNYVELAEKGVERAECYYKAGMISMAIQEESRGEKELQKAADLGHTQAAEHLRKYREGLGGWDKIAPLPNSDRTNTSTTNTGASSDGPARLAIASGDLGKGVIEYEKLLVKDPTNVTYLRGLAGLHYRRGDLDQAIEVANRGLQAHPNDVKLLRYRGNAYERRFDRTGQGSDLTEALADYRKASAIDPNDKILQLELKRASDKN